jgi:hypothetical protein
LTTLLSVIAVLGTVAGESGAAPDTAVEATRSAAPSEAAIPLFMSFSCL